MNLYRSFGNLMEVWVAEQNSQQDSGWNRNQDGDSATSSLDIGTTLRTDSVDSGVETASSSTSYPATPSSMSKELDAFLTDREADGADNPVSPLESPLPSSSSSPHLGSHGRSTPLHLKVERALQRTDRKHPGPTPVSVDEVLKRRPWSSVQQKGSAAEVKGQRSQSFAVKRTVGSSAPTRQTPDSCRRPLSMIHDSQLLQEVCEEENTDLSPAFSYLENVCQMLERIAKDQMSLRSSQIEMDSLQSHESMPVNQATHAYPGPDLQASEGESAACRRLRTEGLNRIGSEPQRRKHNVYGHIRKRSSSDTSVATLHLRRLNTDSRGQHRSNVDLLEEREEESLKKEVPHRKNWKSKFLSLTKGDCKALKSHGSVSSERVSPRRRLSQLFRRTRKTVPA